MIDAMKEMFWHVGTQLVGEVLPSIIAIILLMGLVYSALGIGVKR